MSVSSVLLLVWLQLYHLHCHQMLFLLLSSVLYFLLLLQFILFIINSILVVVVVDVTFSNGFFQNVWPEPEGICGIC